MFIEAKNLINLPVGAFDEQSKIGKIKEILIDPETGRLLGFLINPGGFLSKALALSIVDISQWDKDALITNSVENLVPPEEIVRIKEVLSKNIILLGLKATTESGKNIGNIENFLIDTDTDSVVKYYLKDLFGKSRILPSDKVIKIEKTIVFSDDVNEPTPNAVDAQIA